MQKVGNSQNSKSIVMDVVKIGKVGKSENSKTDEERIMKRLRKTKIVRNTRYCQRLEKNNNTSNASITSPAKIWCGMKCAKVVSKD